jgi:hypothetical protein
MFGYIKDSRKPRVIEVISDSAGVIYLPNVGYLLTEPTPRRLSLVWNGQVGSQLYTSCGERINYEFVPVERIQGTSIEICQYNPPLLSRLFRDKEGNPVTVEVTRIARQHVGHLNAAFRVIKEVYPSYYEDIIRCVRKIVIFKSGQLNSFASLSAHGTAFLNTSWDDDEVFFIEDILHQCGHVIFSAFTLSREAYLAVDPDTELQRVTDREDETRTIYVTLHGVFTEAAMNHCLDLCCDIDFFTPRQRHELLGRLTFILTRFANDVTNLNHKELFTPNGQLIFKEFKRTLARIYAKRGSLLSTFPISNQTYNFSYAKFVGLNPLPSTAEAAAETNYAVVPN